MTVLRGIYDAYRMLIAYVAEPPPGYYDAEPNALLCLRRRADLASESSASVARKLKMKPTSLYLVGAHVVASGSEGTIDVFDNAGSVAIELAGDDDRLHSSHAMTGAEFSLRWE